MQRYLCEYVSRAGFFHASEMLQISTVQLAVVLTNLLSAFSTPASSLTTLMPRLPLRPGYPTPSWTNAQAPAYNSTARRDWNTLNDDEVVGEQICSVGHRINECDNWSSENEVGENGGESEALDAEAVACVNLQ